MPSPQVLKRRRESPPHARPAHQARSRETRDRLLAAAERVFEAKGYEGSRIADIAKAAGCSVGAVYVRFKDKEALFNGIVAEFAAESAANLASAADDPHSKAPASLIRAFIRDTAAQFAAHRGMFRAILERGFGDPDALAPIMAIRGKLEDVLEEALLKAPRKPKDARLSVRVATQMIFGFLVSATINPFAPAREAGPRAVAELETAILRYLELE